MTEVRAGIYQHYKGPLYLVLGLAHDANADTLGETAQYIQPAGDYPGKTVINPLDERTVVVYVPLQLSGAHLGPRMAVRTLADFTAWVHADGSRCVWDGFKFHCADQRLRFEYLGPELTQAMLV